jgi:hypothetical protein
MPARGLARRIDGVLVIGSATCHILVLTARGAPPRVHAPLQQALDALPQTDARLVALVAAGIDASHAPARRVRRHAGSACAVPGARMGRMVRCGRGGRPTGCKARRRRRPGATSTVADNDNGRVV